MCVNQLKRGKGICMPENNACTGTTVNSMQQEGNTTPVQSRDFIKNPRLCVISCKECQVSARGGCDAAAWGGEETRPLTKLASR